MKAKPMAGDLRSRRGDLVLGAWESSVGKSETQLPLHESAPEVRTELPTHLSTFGVQRGERQKTVPIGTHGKVYKESSVLLHKCGSCPPRLACLPAGYHLLALLWFPWHAVSVSPSVPPPSPFLQGASLRADRCCATARSRGPPRCPSSPSSSSTTSPSSWPRPGPSTASPSSTASRAVAVPSSLPLWLSPLRKAQPQPPQESHRHSHPRPPAGVPEKLGLNRRPHGHHPWEATPLSGAPAPLGLALTRPRLPPAPLLQSRPQQQRVSPHGATLVLPLCGLPPPSSH